MQKYPLLPTLAFKKVVLYLSVQLPELLSVALVIENSFSWLWSLVSDIPFGLKMAFRFGGRLDLLMAFRSFNLCLRDLGELQLIASEMCLLGSPPCPSWWPLLTCALGSDLYAGRMFCPKVPSIKLPLTGSLWGTPPQCTGRHSWRRKPDSPSPAQQGRFGQWTYLERKVEVSGILGEGVEKLGHVWGCGQGRGTKMLMGAHPGVSPHWWGCRCLPAAVRPSGQAGGPHCWWQGSSQAWQAGPQHQRSPGLGRCWPQNPAGPWPARSRQS